MAYTYVCSDVHAHTKIFKNLLNFLKEDDILYIIGDVVDKGDGTLDVLKLIMNDPRCHMIIGNHDLMFLAFITLYNCEITFSNNTYQSYLYDDYMVNDGSRTLDDYYSLSEKERMDIQFFLEDLPVIKNIRVNNRDFLLVHAYACRDNDMNVIDLRKDNFYSNCDSLLDKYSYVYIAEEVWGRGVSRAKGKIVITGHTINRDGKIRKSDGWYDIDCGLAYKGDRLGVLRLDDLKEFYVGEYDIKGKI